MSDASDPSCRDLKHLRWLDASLPAQVARAGQAGVGGVQSGFEVEPVVQIARPLELQGVSEEWQAFWGRCPQADPFSSPAWLLPWARHYAPDRCGAALLRSHGQLVGVVPVFCWEGALLLAGTGPSDRAGALIQPGFEHAATRLIPALTLAAPEPFDRIDLQQLAPDSPLRLAAPAEGWRAAELEGVACVVAPLVGDRGLGAASSRQRSHWRHGLRQLERSGGSTGLVEGNEVAPAIEDLLRLNHLRWGDAGVLRDRLIRAFLLDAGPELDRAGLLRLWQVHLHGRRIAVLLVLAGPWAHHGYIGGFDPAHSKLSPSALLVGLAMERAAHEGKSWFDFLRGEETYKTLWGGLPWPMHRRVFQSLTLD